MRWIVGRLVCLQILALAAVAPGEQVYVVRFQSPGPLVAPPCGYLSWGDHLVFHNSTSAEASIRLLGVSNGARRADAIDLALPAERTSSILGTALNWNPDSATNLFVNRLEVPSGILVTSRLEAVTSVSAPCPVSTERSVVVSLPFPIFRALTPANVRQFHLATELGSDGRGTPANARLNVGIYNAAAVSANARIEVRRGCNDSLLTSRSLVVEANTIVQVPDVLVPGVPDLDNVCSSLGFPYRALDYNRYAIVVVDQPSLSYAVTLSNELPMESPITVSFTN